MARYTNKDIISLCDRITAICNRINKKLDVMDEQQRLFTYADSYPPLQYLAPAHVTPWQTTAEPYFHQPLPPPNTHQPTQPPDPPDWQCHSPTNNQPTYTAPPYDHPPLVDSGFHPSPDQLGWQQLYYHQISATSAVDQPFYTTSDEAASPLHPLMPPRSPSSWWSPGHYRSAATLLAAAPPPSLLSDDNTPTMVLGEDVSDGIVPNNTSVGVTLDVPNDKVLEEIVKNDKESLQVLVEATAEKNRVYDDNNLPQVSNLPPLLKRGVVSLPIGKEVMEILIQDGLIMFGWISGAEYIQLSGQAGHRGIGEGRRLTIRCAFDPGGESSPKLLFVLLFVSLFVVAWFPP